MGNDSERLLREKAGDSAGALLEAKVAQFGGLLSNEAAARLLCMGMGVFAEEKVPLSSAKNSRSQFSFAAKITRVFPLQQFEGSRDRSLRVFVSEGGASATVVLWNEQADRFFGEISLLDRVEFRGAQFKSGEIWIGRQGAISVLEKFPITQLPSLKEGPASVRGVAYGVEQGPKGYPGSAFSFSIEGDGASAKVVAWSEKGNGPSPPSQGSLVLLENAFFSKGTLHLSGVSRLVLLGKKNERGGEISSISLQGGDAVFFIGGENFRAPILQGLSMLGISSLPDGVSADTAIAILSEGFSGSKVRYSSDGSRLISLRLA